MEVSTILYSLCYFIAALILLFIARFIYDLATPYAIRDQLTTNSSTAVGIVLAGYLGGFISVIAGVFTGGPAPEPPSVFRFIHELPSVLLYASMGMAALVIAGWVNDKFILHRFSITRELIDHSNIGVANVLAGSFVGSGLIIAGGISGSFSAASFGLAFVLGQVGLVAFSMVYRRLTKHDEMGQLSKYKNSAVGIAWSGNLVAYSLILSTGLARMNPFGTESLLNQMQIFSFYALSGIILLPLARELVDRFFIPGMRLRDQIVGQQNVGVGLIKATLAISVAIMIVWSF
ncbi:MAG: DUF350 domain-containing protein [Magnetococcales bacterium]|nr:DUF350 domain-containing protein [Magnetococcales bacterium]